jgi:uncharacterized protein involved in propanediol utilization
MSTPQTVDTAASRPTRTGFGRSFGTFGELLQGVLKPEGDHFMVTLPVARWSRASFRRTDTRVNVTVAPAHKWKAARAATAALQVLGHRGGGSLIIDSDLPEGKGMASSSADLVAAVRAVASSCGERFSPESIADLLRPIEPTDGVMYDETTVFDHREVRLRRRLGRFPSMVVLAFDEGGQVDTIGFNRGLAGRPAAVVAEYRDLLAQVEAAASQGDLASAGQAATRSTELNAADVARPKLPLLKLLNHDIGGLGIACAHSGTMLGILLPADDAELDAKVDHARRRAARLLTQMTVHRTLGPNDTW